MVGIAFFYFSFRDTRKQNRDGMLRALLLQLSVQLQDGGSDLDSLYQLHKHRTPPAGALFSSLLSVLDRFDEVFILLDALDESPGPESERRGVLDLLKKVRRMSSKGVHLLVTSRLERDIRTFVDKSDGRTLVMGKPEVNRDISNFISSQLKDEPDLQECQEWEDSHGEIEEKLTERADGS